MDGQPAKILGGGDLRRVLGAARQRRYPDRNRVMVLLSVKAGFRACEIARLTWPMVIDAELQDRERLELPAKAAKKGSGRGSRSTPICAAPSPAAASQELEHAAAYRRDSGRSCQSGAGR